MRSTDVRLRKARPGDVRALIRIEKQAFLGESKKYHVTECPENETEEELRARLDSCDVYCILRDGSIVGGVYVRKPSASSCRLMRIYIDPARQGEGIGKRVLEMIEGMYPECSRWELDTPSDNERTVAFYKSRGYTIKGRNRINEYLELLDFEKG